MSLRRSGGDTEALTDFLVRAPGCDQLNDLPLSLCDVWKRVPQRVVHDTRR